MLTNSKRIRTSFPVTAYLQFSATMRTTENSYDSTILNLLQQSIQIHETSVFLIINCRSFSLSSLALSYIRISSKTFAASCVSSAFLEVFSQGAVLQLVWNFSNSGIVVPEDVNQGKAVEAELCMAIAFFCL